MSLCCGATLIKTVIQPKVRPSNKVTFLIDVSGSVASEMDQVFSAFQAVAGVPTDDLQVAAWVFATHHMRCPGAGFFKMPSQDHLDTLTEFIAFASVGTDTYICDLLAKVKAVPGSVAIVSDFNFYHEPDALVMAAAGKRPFMCFSVGDKLYPVAKTLGKRGGLWTVK